MCTCSAAISHEEFFGRELEEELDSYCLNWLRDLHRVSLDEGGIESVWPSSLRAAMYFLHALASSPSHAVDNMLC